MELVNVRKSSLDAEVFKLASCGPAIMDANATPSNGCFVRVKKLCHNPSCLSALMLSNSAKSARIKPEIAMTISKSCNIADRPVGYKCGGRLAREEGAGISVGHPLETVRFFFSVRVYCDDVITICEYGPQLVFRYNGPKSLSNRWFHCYRDCLNLTNWPKSSNLILLVQLTPG
ncbi:uncharacterized protein LOC131321223 [Rhododendron vialii]|uniref:uncharacterized protein LOC131321223 n=1 Tax=Rhododendron vialii TaxID=182163 RepID=UPI00265FD5B9|nr:uncharacterized protein LOC131321223 [Rhododendron vialii]